METNGITEIGDDRYRDSDYQEYRLETISDDIIELFPEGTGGKRGFIRFDESGFFNDWSGMITELTEGSGEWFLNQQLLN